MPPNIPPELISQLLAMLQGNPEYSQKNGWLPMDGSDQRGALNFTQDLMGQAQDPMFAAMLGPAAYDPNAMALAMQTYQAPVATGQQFLEKVAGDGTARGFVAAAILGGDTPEVALQRVVGEYGGADALGKDGEVSKELKSFAEDAWTGLLSDSPGSGTKDPFTQAGFTNPEARFTPEMYDQTLGDKSAKAKQAQAAAKKATSAADEWAKQHAQTTAISSKAPAGGTGAPQAQPAPGAHLPGIAAPVPAQDVIGQYVQQAIQANKPNLTPATSRLAIGPAQGPAVMPKGQFGPSANVYQNQQQANLGAYNATNENTIAQAHALARSRADTQAYGSPFLLQLATRLAGARGFG